MVTAFCSAVLTSVTGLGGGVLLFSILSSLLSLREAVALHGFLQMVSNGSRMILFFKKINWSIGLRFCLALIPGCFLGVKLFDYLNPSYLKFFVGVTSISLSFMA